MDRNQFDAEENFDSFIKEFERLISRLDFYRKYNGELRQRLVKLEFELRQLQKEKEE